MDVNMEFILYVYVLYCVICTSRCYLLACVENTLFARGIASARIVRINLCRNTLVLLFFFYLRISLNQSVWYSLVGNCVVVVQVDRRAGNVRDLYRC